ncbi:unnamed protein product [Malus baccata var. baccata]
MVQFLGTIRLSSLSYFATYKRQLSLHSPPITAPANGFSPFRRIFNSYLQSCFVVVVVVVCLIAVEPGNRNKRLNTSILIRYPRPSGNYNILIDAGKFFYYSALQWFTAHGIRIIDAVIITHSHADAIGGLDDLCDWTNNVQPTIPIYVPQHDFEVMKKTHYYLVDTSVVLAGAAVSELQFNIIHEDPFVVQDLKVRIYINLVYIDLRYSFGNVCYISDVSDIPEETYPLLKDCELLILVTQESKSTHSSIRILFTLPFIFHIMEESKSVKPSNI